MEARVRSALRVSSFLNVGSDVPSKSGLNDAVPAARKADLEVDVAVLLQPHRSAGHALFSALVPLSVLRRLELMTGSWVELLCDRTGGRCIVRLELLPEVCVQWCTEISFAQLSLDLIL
jgi:hypothetical protein